MNSTFDLKLTKDLEDGVKVSAKTGVKYLNVKHLVEDTIDGAKWYNGVAFGAMADLLATRLKKGIEIRVVGPLTTKEYLKKDGSVGFNNNLIFNKVTFEGGDTIDKFTQVGATPT